MLNSISIDQLILILAILLGLVLFLRKLTMPLQYYEHQEFFSDKLRERINMTEDYFNVIEEVEPGDLTQGVDEKNADDINVKLEER